MLSRLLGLGYICVRPLPFLSRVHRLQGVWLFCLASVRLNSVVGAEGTVLYYYSCRNRRRKAESLGVVATTTGCGN